MVTDDWLRLSDEVSPAKKRVVVFLHAPIFFFSFILGHYLIFPLLYLPLSMSKRQRDEANVSSMQAILGDVPVATIENLLYRSNNNVEAALNLYFTSPVPTIPAATAKSASSTSSIKSKPSPASKAFQGKKYYIGDLVITGM